MKKEELTKILFSMPEELSIAERQTQLRILMVSVAGLFFLFGLIYIYCENPFASADGILFLSLLLLTIFTLVDFALRNRFLKILRIASILVFCYLIVSRSIINRISWLLFAGLIVYLSRVLFNITSDIRTPIDPIAADVTEEAISEKRTIPLPNFLRKNLGTRGFIWALIIFAVGLALISLFIFFNQ